METAITTCDCSLPLATPSQPPHKPPRWGEKYLKKLRKKLRKSIIKSITKPIMLTSRAKPDMTRLAGGRAPQKLRKKLRIFLKNETQQPRKTKPIRDDRKSAQIYRIRVSNFA
ncbi:hypothetical protein A8535_001237 [Escherichia coli]|nr:hypothetical protein [Escherichia coli]